MRLAHRPEDVIARLVGDAIAFELAVEHVDMLFGVVVLVHVIRATRRQLPHGNRNAFELLMQTLRSPGAELPGELAARRAPGNLCGLDVFESHRCSVRRTAGGTDPPALRSVPAPRQPRGCGMMRR